MGQVPGAVLRGATGFNVASQFDLAAHTDKVKGVSGDISIAFPGLLAETYVTED